ncbi:MAG TPA: hypothetical protein VMP11_17640 [Verrucomicrobiae bacterium]|nr:hypothetical protein [Verrucomicrobiae bacterium]
MRFELFRDEQARTYTLAEIHQMLSQGDVAESAIARSTSQKAWRPLSDLLKAMEPVATEPHPIGTVNTKWAMPDYFLVTGRIGRMTYIVRNLLHLMMMVAAAIVLGLPSPSIPGQKSFVVLG